MIEGEHIKNSVALGENDDRSISEPNLEAGITSQDHESRSHVLGAEGFKPIGASGDLVEQRTLRSGAYPDGEQVIQLGQDERREQQGWAGIAKSCHGLGMVVLAAVEGSQQPASVEENHLSPKPSRSLSTFSARSGLPLLNRGSLGFA